MVHLTCQRLAQSRKTETNQLFWTHRFRVWDAVSKSEPAGSKSKQLHRSLKSFRWPLGTPKQSLGVQRLFGRLKRRFGFRNVCFRFWKSWFVEFRTGTYENGVLDKLTQCSVCCRGLHDRIARVKWSAEIDGQSMTLHFGGAVGLDHGKILIKINSANTVAVNY